MNAGTQRLPYVAALLRRHQYEIAAAWAEKAHNLPDTRYGQYPIEEILSWTSAGVAATVETLATGAQEATEKHLINISLDRLRAGFDISEVIHGLLLFKEAALPYIRGAYLGPSRECCEVVAHLDEYLRYMIGRFAHLYAEAMNRDLRVQQERTSLILDATSTANSSLELDQVLRRIVEKGAETFGLGCALYSLDPERGVLTHQIRSGPPHEHHDVSGELELSSASSTLIQEMVKRHRSIACYDADAQSGQELVQTLGLEYALLVPIVTDDRILVAVIGSTSDDNYRFTQEDIELAEGIANTVALALQNAQLYEKTRQQLAESRSLLRLTEALLQKLTLDEVLEIVCFEAQELTFAAGSAVLLREDEAWLRVTHRIGSPMLTSDRLPVEGSISGLAMGEAEPLLINDVEGRSDEYALDPGLKHLLVVPLRSNGAIIGTLNLANRAGGFTQDDMRIVNLFARQAAIAIENAQLHHEAERLAVMEERQRLARELHDSVTQALYSMTLYAEATRLAMSTGKEGVATENLRELQGMARQATVDMRLLIFELHPPALEEEGLVAVLQARLAAVETRAGLQTEMVIEGDRSLPLPVEEELYWIAQEALNNVVKHAEAQRVMVRLQFDDESVCLEVRDDGIGFDPAETREAGGVGLRGMWERAQRINGRLEIRSTPGEGTDLRVVAAS